MLNQVVLLIQKGKITWFNKIDDPILYRVVRVDKDKHETKIRKQANKILNYMFKP